MSQISRLVVRCYHCCMKKGVVRTPPNLQNYTDRFSGDHLTVPLSGGIVTILIKYLGPVGAYVNAGHVT